MEPESSCRASYQPFRQIFIPFGLYLQLSYAFKLARWWSTSRFSIYYLLYHASFLYTIAYIDSQLLKKTVQIRSHKLSFEENGKMKNERRDKRNAKREDETESGYEGKRSTDHSTPTPASTRLCGSNINTLQRHDIPLGLQMWHRLNFCITGALLTKLTKRSRNEWIATPQPNSQEFLIYSQPAFAVSPSSFTS